ncbi:hypothetical protein HK101_009152 [Irineochytrium annulatum]|nr:hypothetical protein HK101_009152 [Irineochytrium annulatum]
MFGTATAESGTESGTVILKGIGTGVEIETVTVTGSAIAIAMEEGKIGEDRESDRERRERDRNGGEPETKKLRMDSPSKASAKPADSAGEVGTNALKYGSHKRVQTLALIEQKRAEIAAKMAAFKAQPGGLGGGGTPALSKTSLLNEAKSIKMKIESGMAASTFRQPNTTMFTSAIAQQENRLKKGLKVEVHPLFAEASADVDSIRTIMPKTNFATIKANQRVPDKAALAAAAAAAAAAIEKQAAEEEKKELLIIKEAPAEFSDPAKNPYFDPNISAKASMPKPKVHAKSFKFVQKGTYVKQANDLRQQALLEKLKANIAATVKRAGIEVELELVSDLSVRREPPPNVEWWDAQLVGPDAEYESFDVDSKVATEAITNLIQHPVPIQPPAEPGAPPPKPLMLTAKERKKLRRQKRLEAQKEKRDKIRLGLLPADQPKMKISNLMRVLGTEAVQDPTQMEAIVRAQMRQRQQKHEKYISDHKLTKEQKRERKRLKLLENTHVIIEVAVFKVLDLSRSNHKFKVNVNAVQLNLTGVIILYSGMNLIIVEGGNRGIKQYKKLMLRRIDWNEGGGADDDEGEGEDVGEAKEKGPNECEMVWEGKIKRRLFQGFRVRTCATERDVKELLEKAGASHYWDSAKFKVAD